jgi:DNA-binding protein HU-beta
MAQEKTAEKSAQTIGRQELSKRIAKQAKLSQKQAAEVLEATLDAIREALQNGDEVRLVGFGSFKVRQSAARKGVNPRDRQPIEVPAKEVIARSDVLLTAKNVSPLVGIDVERVRRLPSISTSQGQYTTSPTISIW